MTDKVNDFPMTSERIPIPKEEIIQYFEDFDLEFPPFTLDDDNKNDYMDRINQIYLLDALDLNHQCETFGKFDEDGVFLSEPNLDHTQLGEPIWFNGDMFLNKDAVRECSKQAFEDNDLCRWNMYDIIDGLLEDFMKLI